MTLSDGDRRKASHEDEVARSRQADGRTRRAPAEPEPRVDDALLLAIETLSAEICWFVATDAGARGVFDEATARWPRPSS